MEIIFKRHEFSSPTLRIQSKGQKHNLKDDVPIVEVVYSDAAENYGPGRNIESSSS